MSTIAPTALLGKPAPSGFKSAASAHLFSALVILFMLLDGLVKLMPWPAVTDMFDRIGYGSSEALARTVGAISNLCPALYAMPPTSIPNAILIAGYLGGVVAPHVRIEGPLFTQIVFGAYLGLTMLAGLFLGNVGLRAEPASRH